MRLTCEKHVIEFYFLNVFYYNFFGGRGSIFLCITVCFTVGRGEFFGTISTLIECHLLNPLGGEGETCI